MDDFVPGFSPSVDVVVKVGGSLLAHPAQLDASLAAIEAAAAAHRLLIVPGGGPFADAVREADRRFGVSDDAAHWMAVLAMDQYAHLLAGRLRGAILVSDRGGIDEALRGGRKKPLVLAPFRWLRDADPLPHSWEVTSDSIAAWIAGALGARRLVLVKPPGASGTQVVDTYFHRALPADVDATSVAADRLEVLGPLLVTDARSSV